LGKIEAKFGQSRSEIWTRVIRFGQNLNGFRQNQNLASPKTFDPLRLWSFSCYATVYWRWTYSFTLAAWLSKTWLS